jgi:hypothetical protein
VTKTPNTPVTTYLRLVADLNPIWRSSELVDLRAQQFNIPRMDRSKSFVDSTGDLQQLRDAYKEFLGRIQAQFWQMPQPMLLQQLASINTARLPELVPVLDRLKTVANCRSEFPKLAQEPWMVGPLFHTFKTAVVLPQAEAGIVRERFTGSIPSRKELGAIRNAVAKIEQSYPVLFALERNFFQTLLKLELNPHRPLAQQYESNWPRYVWISIVIGFLILRVLLVLFRTSGAGP